MLVCYKYLKIVPEANGKSTLQVDGNAPGINWDRAANLLAFQDIQTKYRSVVARGEFPTSLQPNVLGEFIIELRATPDEILKRIPAPGAAQNKSS